MYDWAAVVVKASGARGGRARPIIRPPPIDRRVIESLLDSTFGAAAGAGT